MVLKLTVYGTLQTNNKMATTTTTTSVSASVNPLTSWTIIINGVAVPVEYPQNSQKQTIEFILAVPKVKAYFAKINPKYIAVSKVTIFHHVMFGATNFGFLFMNVVCTHKPTGKFLPGVVFLRGDAVSCLTLVKNSVTGAMKMLLLEQCRVPAGGPILESNAGMEDEKVGQKRLTMTKEAQEETGIEISSSGVPTGDARIQFNYLEQLGEAGMSMGGCDEKITFFWYMVERTPEEIQAMSEKHIINEEGESAEIIKLVLEDFTMANALKSGDAKVMCTAAFLTQKYPGFMPLY